MKTKAVTRESLEALIKSIDDELAAIDEKLGERPGWKSYEAMRAYDEREQAEIADLCARMTACMGARFNHMASDSRTMRLAGVSSSCTSGARGLFSNWQNAARRRIAQMEPSR